MAKETMTIHKALSKLKSLPDRISTEMERSFVTQNKHSNQKIFGASIADFCNGAKASYQAVRTLINEENAIKQAIAISNATTKVNVNGSEMTVAEAIYLKTQGIKRLESLYDTLRTQLSKAQRMADMENGERLESRADEYVKALYSGADMKNLADDVKKVRDAFIESQTVELVDPLHAEEVCRKLKEYIDGFNAEVDAALSVSNALNTIEVEYETL